MTLMCVSNSVVDAMAHCPDPPSKTRRPPSPSFWEGWQSTVLTESLFQTCLGQRQPKVKALHWVTRQHQGVKAQLLDPNLEDSPAPELLLAQPRLLFPLHCNSNFLYLKPSFFPPLPQVVILRALCPKTLPALQIFLTESASQKTQPKVYSIMVKSMGSGIRLPGFKSSVCHFQAVFPSASYS